MNQCGGKNRSDDSSLSFFSKVSSSFGHLRVLGKSIHQTYSKGSAGKLYTVWTGTLVNLNTGTSTFENNNCIKALKNKNLQFGHRKALSLVALEKEGREV